MNDSRHDIERDAGELVADYARNGSVCDALYDGILGLLDRQAAITEREVEHDLMKAGRMAVEVERERIAELQAELDEYDQTHMPLPVDADGVPIRLGDKMKYADGTEFEVDGIGLGGTLFSVDDASNSAWWTNAEGKRHAPERTVEDVLREFGERVCRSGHQWGLDAHDMVAEYAAELRELTGGVR